MFFGKVTLIESYGLKLWMPDLATLDWRVVVLAIISGVLLLRQHWGIAPVLAIASGLGLAIRLAGI